MKGNKIDFRRGNRASRRTVEAMNAIREVLAQGDTTFSILLERTGLSRRALASNLKRLLERGEIKRWVGEGDHRFRYYSLDDLGWERYRQQKVSQILRNVELTPLGCIMDAIIEYIATALIVATRVTELQKCEPGESSRLPQLTEDEEGILISCLKGKIYARSSKNKEVGYFEALKEFLAVVKLVATRKDIDTKLLEELPDIVFELKISKDRLIELCESLRKVGKYMLTSDFIRLCRSMGEKDFEEFLKTLGIDNG